MGFQPKQTHYRLRFADPELNGLVVTARAGTMRSFVAVTKLAALKDLGDNMRPEHMEMVDVAFSEFGSLLVDWNIEDEDGQPVPATKDGLYAQELPLAMAILAAWSTAVGGVSDPLRQTSSATSSALEASIPMETLSAVLPS